MPRKKLPSYRLHRSSGQAIVTLSGKMIYLGLHGSAESRHRYDQAIASWLVSNRQVGSDRIEKKIVSGGAAVISVNELIVAYWRHALRYYRRDGRPTGEIAPLRAVIKLLRQSFGRAAVNEFGPLKLQELQKQMIQKGWARSTINSQLKRTVRIFAWGVTQELVPATIAAGLREVRGLERGRSEARESSPIDPVTDNAFEQTLPYLPPVVADLLRLSRKTGMRPEEACTIRPVDVDRTGEIWIYTPRRHKTEHHGRTRTVPLGPQCQMILAPYLNRAADAYCFSPRESESLRRTGNRSCLEASQQRDQEHKIADKAENGRRSPGDRYDASSLRHAIHRACLKAFPIPEELNAPPGELPADQEERESQVRCWIKRHRWSANQLRHTFATEVRRRFGLEAAQVLLGHSEADVTQLYALADVKKAVELARSIS